MANTWTGPIFDDNKIKYSYTADQAQTSGYTLKLATENKFVDQDIWAKIIIPSGSLSAGAGEVTFNNNNATGLFGTSSTTVPSSGNYITITGKGAVSVGTGGWIDKDTALESNVATKYYPINSATFSFGTGANANKLYCTTSGYVAKNSETELISIGTQIPTTSYANTGLSTYFNTVSNPSSDSDYDISITPRYSNNAGYVTAHSNTNNGGIGYWSIKTTSIVQTNTTTVNGTTATGATATWGTGWATSGSISAATFDSKPTGTKTDDSYVDISETTSAPILISNSYLYINRGYIDDIKISLARLVPDSATKPTGASNYSSGLLTGYALYDENGALVTGSIGTITLPTETTTSAATNYTSKATIYATNADQYLNIPAGFNAANSYYKLNKLTASNFTPANIKHNVTISVNNGSSNVYTQKGTFTSASTAQSSNGAATAAQILKNYGAWVDGTEITGSIESRSWPTSTATSATSGYSGTTFNTSTSNRYINLSSGYYSANKYYLIRGVTTSGNITAGNIKYGVVMKVGDSADDDRIVAAVTGTFTSASTVSSGQTAAQASQILSGYSAWVNGAEVKGSIATKTSTNLTFDGSTRTFTAPAGYYASAATKQIAAATITASNGSVNIAYDTTATSIYKSSTNTAGVAISSNAPASDSGKVCIKITGSGAVTNTIGWLNSANSTSSNNASQYVTLNKYDGTFTTG